MSLSGFNPYGGTLNRWTGLGTNIAAPPSSQPINMTALEGMNTAANQGVRALLAARGLAPAGGTGVGGVNAIPMDRTAAVNTPAGAPKPITATAVPVSKGLPAAAGVKPQATPDVPMGDTTPQSYIPGTGGSMDGVFSPDQMSAIHQNILGAATTTAAQQAGGIAGTGSTATGTDGTTAVAGQATPAGAAAVGGQAAPAGATASAIRGIAGSGWAAPAQDTSASSTLGATGAQMLAANQLDQPELARSQAFESHIDTLLNQLKQPLSGSLADNLEQMREHRNLAQVLGLTLQADPNKYKEAMREQGQRIGAQMLGGASQAQTQQNIENVRAAEAAYGAQQGIYGQMGKGWMAAQTRAGTVEPKIIPMRGATGADAGIMRGNVYVPMAQLQAEAAQAAQHAAQSSFIARLKNTAGTLQGSDGKMYRWDSARNGVVRVEQ